MTGSLLLGQYQDWQRKLGSYYSKYGMPMGTPAAIERITHRIMDQRRIHDISVEMANLLEQQRRLLNAGRPLTEVEPEEMQQYAERNQRLRDLCKELTEV